MNRLTAAVIATAVFGLIVRQFDNPLIGLGVVFGILALIVVGHRLITGYWHPDQDSNYRGD